MVIEPKTLKKLDCLTLKTKARRPLEMPATIHRDI
jgi:hypothetical protein